MNKRSFETDWRGKHKVIEQPNGIKIRLLKEPSAEYLEKIRLREEKIKAIDVKQSVEIEKQKLIQAKIKEIAERELKEEGKI